jgi:O-antigen ligase/polysaccharide polymerase Wzy-like membrane protein
MLVAAVIAATVAAVFIWWAWKQGAYFGSVFLPGALILYALLILLLFGSPLNARLRGVAAVAMAAIVALAGLTLLSIAWTPANDAAVQDAQRAILYAAVFALGIWCCNLSGRRLYLPLAVVAATGVVVGVVITITLAGGTDVPSIFHDDATLRFPIGYRNAEAAFLLICLWPLLTLAASRELPWQLRALMIGASTMLFELVVLSESRGSLGATLIALAVFLGLSRDRLRVATYLALAAIPVLPAVPTLLDVFQHGGDGPGLIPLMRDSARAIALTSLASVVLAAVCIGGAEPRLKLGQQRTQLISRIAAVAALAAVLVGAGVFVAKRGGPLEFVSQRVDEFKYQGNPNLQPEGTRFGVHVGSNRDDFWRVSLDQASDHPLLGGGAGSFEEAYLRRRESLESPKDPHSVEMLMLSELGIVGLALFGTFVVAAAIAGFRSRSLGPSGAVLCAGSLASGAYWLVHSSYDWFWHYPGVTAPALFLLGAAAAPPLFELGVGGAKRLRYAGIAVFAVAALIAVPLFLSQRFANRGYDEYPADPNAAISDIDRAASWDPYDPSLLLAKGVIESRLGREEDAVSSFRDAIDRDADNYAAHLFLARALAPTDLTAARAEVAEALRLNPLDPEVRREDRRLQRRSRQ